MNIVLINHYAGSLKYGMEYRPFYLAREWVKQGHHVDIISASYSHVRTVNPTVSKDFETEVDCGITYHWVRATEYSGNGAKRALSMFQFVGKLILHAKQLSQKLQPDVVISSSTYPLDTYAAQKIASFTNAAVIHEVHDMWPLTLTEIAGMSKMHPFILLLQAAENSAYKNSDAVVSLLPNAKDYMIEHGMQKDHFYYVPNGIVTSDWDNKQPLPEEQFNTLKRMKSEGKLLCAYFGSHTNTYGLKYFIDSSNLIDKDKINILLVGDGMEKENFKKQAQIAGYKNVFFLNPVPKQAIPSLLEFIDIVYVGGTRSKMRKFGAAMNKVYDSMMAGKPIVYAVDIPNNDVETYHCGIIVELESAEAIAKGINSLAAMSVEERKAIGENGHRAALEHYDYKVISKNFADIMQKLSEDR